MCILRFQHFRRNVLIRYLPIDKRRHLRSVGRSSSVDECLDPIILSEDEYWPIASTEHCLCIGYRARGMTLIVYFPTRAHTHEMAPHISYISLYMFSVPHGWWPRQDNLSPSVSIIMLNVYLNLRYCLWRDSDWSNRIILVNTPVHMMQSVSLGCQFRDNGQMIFCSYFLGEW